MLRRVCRNGVAGPERVGEVRSRRPPRVRLVVLAPVAMLLFALPGELPATAAVSPLSITTSGFANAVVGSSYSTQLEASGGTPPYTWAVATGALPGGFLLSSSGELFGLPAVAGSSTINIRVNDSLGLVATRSLPLTIVSPPPPPETLIALNAQGAVSTVGSSATFGAGENGDADPVGVAGSSSGLGAWVVTPQGEVSGLHVASFGSVGPGHLRGRIVALSAVPSGRGYLLLSSAGRVYGFGTARNLGPVAGLTHRVHAVGLAATGNRGYLVVLSDGSVEAFGTATDYGGVAAGHLRGRIVGLAALPRGGYVLVSSTGRIYRYGPATSIPLPNPRPTSAVAIAPSPVGAGYWVVEADGAVFAAGSARSLGSFTSAAPVVAVSSMP